jgi:hypothetical protein
VLEVVCLTCQDSISAAMRAPLLLALLLQRASPGVRTTFLNSADGDRLLLALQQLAACKDEGGRGQIIWFWNNHYGALSILDALVSRNVMPYLASSPSRAAHTLAWCFLELNTTPAAAGGAAAAAAATPPSATTSAAVAAAAAAHVTPAAVAKGSVLGHRASSWGGEYCTLGHGLAAA